MEIQKELFSEYEDYKRQIKELEDACAVLKPKLLAMIPTDSKIDTGTSVFTLSSRPRWKYSQATTGLEEELKHLQKEEQMTGIAEQVPGEPFIVCTTKKM